MLNVTKIKKDFPMFVQKINDKDFHYLDNSTTTFKPSSMIEKMNEYYFSYSVNTKRGDYYIANKVDKEYEEARKNFASFINAKDNEISFTSCTTLSLNQIAFSISN